ncbi:bifunctional riboflavin kinase/FAD synthetase [Fusobacterium necrophorum]|uniref:Riboflavin biosynthesis protein n=2 Tax=Fusobacterium necrophorum TaxID=859 RepID=A0AB73BT03_9FUSO|nr:bifunctional riboflavin kinase/FAD synthetase [Fusobacterium necrophorum]AYZ74691.1 bifunctional riboflavin kinase/FAD synthetase [Fusobacterium necrophorum]AZW09423.1 bifunctional riboflavin kinase/FAD synthetase [Fusobacterium necrophorum subsp. necrophorum]KDE60664.1 FMN adenylyltransferase [Fusobacterium necrophorum BL]KDE61142.1 FMN adenylyltransferase [Fusobacterium necrophorum BFTR-1]KDE66330.1 FMN adenylyltransferase [Fusobacterium necrophorum DJ-1]
MKVIKNILEIKENLQKSYVAIGNFDGLHTGHRTIIRKARERAEEKNGVSVVFTFQNHPMELLRKDGRSVKYINTNEEKLFMLEKMGVDYVVLQPFTQNFADLTPLEFVKLLKQKLGVEEIFVGFNFSFGKGGVAKTKDLVYLGRGEGICVHELKAITSGEEVISSTLIRKSMMTGQFAKALKLLGHPMIVIGEVVHGKKIARKLGFPTANIQIKDRLYPPFGIYGAKLQLEGEDRIRYGVINVGVNPTLKPGEFSLEVHILDFDEDIYGKKMYIELMEYLRKEEKFDSVEELIACIANDVAVWTRCSKELKNGSCIKIGEF